MIVLKFNTLFCSVMSVTVKSWEKTHDIITKTGHVQNDPQCTGVGAGFQSSLTNGQSWSDG